MLKFILNKLLESGHCEDFINSSEFCQRIVNKGHKLYFADVWATDVEPLSATGGCVYATDKILVVFDNVKDYARFLVTYPFTGGSGYLDTDEEIIEFFQEAKDTKTISYQGWENLDNKSYYLD